MAPRAGDIVFSYETRLGDAALMPEGLRCCLGRRMALMRPDRSKIVPRFLLYAYLGPEFQETIRSRTIHGSTVNRIPLKDFPSFPIRVPPLDEQHRIAGVLGVLDDKIEHDSRLALQLERLIELRGRHMLATSGGTTCALSVGARFVNGGAFTKHANGSGRPIVRIRELNSGVDPATLRTDLEVSDDHVARDGDLLFAWSGSLDVFRWIGPESLINQHIFKVMPNGYPTWLVELWIRQHLADFRAIASDKATTMGHIQRRHLNEALVTVPTQSELRATADLDAADSLRIQLLQTSKRLAATRDALLPKLVSGALCVRRSYDPDDAIGIVAEAASVAMQ